MSPIPTSRELDGFRSEELVRSAVERKLGIVGEALNRLSREDPKLAAQIPDIRRIIGFRNVLARGYEIVDDEVVWDAATTTCQRWPPAWRPCWWSWMPDTKRGLVGARGLVATLTRYP